MACPQVTDGEDRLQIWKTTPKRLNKQLQTADMMLPQVWGMGKGTTTPHGNKYKCYRKLYRALNFDRTFVMTSAMKNGQECGTWNVCVYFGDTQSTATRELVVQQAA
jgi:hypothetical protein